jgi:DNA-binding transcriptional LysR family regulator
MRSLNLDHLRTLTNVVALGSFSAAARQLHLTQPAVSLQIRDLEARCGVRLVERMGKQAHATAPGRELIEHAQRIFRECNDAEAALRRYREGWVGRVHLATTLTTLIYRLPPILRKISLDHPGIELVVINMPTSNCVAGIIDNTIDLALVNLPVDKKELRVTPLCSEALVAILPSGSKNVPDAVTPEFVARQPLLTEHTGSAGFAMVLGWLAKQSMSREPMPLGTVEALKSAVHSKLGMAIVPEPAATKHRAEFVVRPLRPPLQRTLALIEHRNKPNNPALDIVRSALLALREGAGAKTPGGVGGGANVARAPAARRPARGAR